jgi:prepilin-type processing-associated H-X9-DG protein
VHLLPFIEQGALYNSINNFISIFDDVNLTDRVVNVPAFVCPSDPGAGQARIGYSLALASLGLSSPERPYFVAYGSYAGVYGSFYVDGLPGSFSNCVVPVAVVNQLNGSFNDLSPLRTSSFTDGLSHTAIVTERVLFPLRGISDSGGPAYDRFGWVIAGNWGDSLVTCFYPANMYLRVKGDRTISQFFAPSSLHTNGLNLLFGDGSARFIKDSVATWNYSTSSGLPEGILKLPDGSWTNAPRPGVWQAIATRNGAEVVDSDSF